MPAAVTVTKKPEPRVTVTRRSVPASRKPDTPVADSTPAQAASVPAPVPVVAKKVEVEVKAPVKAQASAPAPAAAPKKIATVTPRPVPEETASSASSSPSSEEPATTKVHVDAKKKRQRPRIRPYSEVFAQVYEDINNAYKALQAATKALKSLESAHNREVHNTRSRANTHRTPTIVFDQPLVDYFLGRLDPSELTVVRKEQDGDVTVDLSDLSTDKRVHRTDVTQLYNKAFVKHDLRDPQDRRYILYQNDPELVALLTQGYSEPKPELQEELQQIIDGTYRLNIFNIQRFTSQHLGKVELPKDTKSETPSEEDAQEA